MSTLIFMGGPFVVDGCWRIHLSKGFSALVDEADFADLCKHKWYASVSNGYGYAARHNATNPEKAILMHRVLLGALPGEEVDHVNGNTLDNRRVNLRRATRSENQSNRGPSRRSSTGLKGVFFDRGRWIARIGNDGRTYHLGRFESPTLAALAYDAKAAELHGGFARFNFPDEPARVVAHPSIHAAATDAEAPHG